MSDRSGIEWTDASWNPVTGCVEVSEGCDHCYARTFAERFRGVARHPYENGFDPMLRPERLDQPLRWRRPRMIFVNSMSDLFQEAVPDEFIAQVFAVMGIAAHHTFQVLTKRAGRMASLLAREDFVEGVRRLLWNDPCAGSASDGRRAREWPFSNVWVGTSAEDQRWADIRIPKLLRTPAAVRFLSCEPLLGPLDLTRCLDAVGSPATCAIGWVIAGGESGAGARPMDPGWARSLRDQCLTAGVPFFFKQWGGRTPKAGGRELDGRTWDEMPARPGVVDLTAVDAAV